MKGGEVIELRGDLGTGKTTFAQGLLRGMGQIDDAPSPTFTLEREYKVRDGLVVHHFDFYRLSGHDIVSQELNEVLVDPRAVTLVEWADHGEVELPNDRLKIELGYGKQESERRLIFSAGPRSHHLIERLQNVSSN